MGDLPAIWRAGQYEGASSQNIRNVVQMERHYGDLAEQLDLQIFRVNTEVRWPSKGRTPRIEVIRPESTAPWPTLGGKKVASSVKHASSRTRSILVKASTNVASACSTVLRSSV